MTRKLSQAMILMLLIQVSIFSLASAQSEQISSSTVTYTADARTARIEKLKSQFKVQLNDKEKELISTRCTLAQARLKSIAYQLDGIESSRGATYDGIISTLLEINNRLNDQFVDTSSLDLLIVDYQSVVKKFNLSIEGYRLSLDDATSIDCKNNPEDFRAALEGVRAARKPIVDSSQQINDLTKTNLKTTFESLAVRLDIGAPNGQ
ncbi:hypothetical protein KC930_03015 [Candidatus Saccharibacteria bacterium]|nr:hypothetical protein [Candidatus Saccharibacteria bacterium]